MKDIHRFAIYYAPRSGGFAEATAAWLGWDAEAGQNVVQPNLASLPGGLAAVTKTARKYGFHGTIKAPFRLADGISFEQVCKMVKATAARLGQVSLSSLSLQNLHGYLALVPSGNQTALTVLAAHVVESLDTLRAPLSVAEIAKRRPDQLTQLQRTMLHRWGYPYAMQAFQFHLTLTDALSDADAAKIAPILCQHLTPTLPRPFVIEDLCLFGEAADGQFRLLHRYELSG